MGEVCTKGAAPGNEKKIYTVRLPACWKVRVGEGGYPNAGDLVHCCINAVAYFSRRRLLRRFTPRNDTRRYLSLRAERSNLQNVISDTVFTK